MSYYYLQEYRGLFRGPLVLEVFAAHISAVESAIVVQGLYDHGNPTPSMIGGLALAAASVRDSHCICLVILTIYRLRGR
jgi:hypothetical protein